MHQRIRNSSSILGTKRTSLLPLPRITLQALEAFERVARSGSMQTAAAEMGMSISSVSHHVARLETQLGMTLLDRSSRPFVLTREGKEALRHLSEGLRHLHRATNDFTVGGLLGTRSLRLGIVEDLESHVAPELAVALASQMPNAKLTIRYVLSHEAPDLLAKGALDIAIASEPRAHSPDIVCDPLLRDPFVIAAPQGVVNDPGSLFEAGSSLPFLRFNSAHAIGAQIESHLVRNRVELPNRFEFDSAQSIMAIVARGGGWSILTALGFVRAQRFESRVSLYPLPIASFARRIALMSRGDFDRRIAQAIATLFKGIVEREAIEMISDQYPWLAESFTIIRQPE